MATYDLNGGDSGHIVSDRGTSAGNVFLIVLVLLLFVAVSAAGVWYFIHAQSSIITSSENETIDHQPDVDTGAALRKEDLPEGSIFLTLQPLGTDFYPMRGYEIHLPEALFPDPNFPIISYWTENIFNTRNEYKSVFVSRDSLLFSDNNPQGYMQLFLLDSVDPFISEQITNSPTVAKMNPEWSHDGKRVVFMGQDEGENSFPPLEGPETWSIFVTDLDGNEQKVAEGAYPQWGPNDRYLVFLKEAGIAVIDLETSEERLVMPSPAGPLKWNSKIDLSETGDKIAISYPEVGKVDVYNVSWTEKMPTMSFASAYDESAYWVVFSPDSKYLAIQAVNSVDPQGTSRIMVYEVATGAYLKLFDLSGYVQTSTFLTDWIYY